METRPPLLVDRRPAQPHEIWGSWRLAGAGGPSQHWSCRCKHCKKGWSGVGRSLQHLACWHQYMQRNIRASNSSTANLPEASGCRQTSRTRLLPCQSRCLICKGRYATQAATSCWTNMGAHPESSKRGQSRTCQTAQPKNTKPR